MYTSGALILTDDGDFVYRLTHPKHQIPKTYNVTVRGEVAIEDINKLREGVDIGGFVTSRAKARILKYDDKTRKTRVEIVIKEGKNRQVRKMLEAVGKSVIGLHRSKIGDLDLQGLKIGEWRYLKPGEIASLKH